MPLRIAHLIDDATPGGVMRCLQRLEAADGPLAEARHQRLHLRRGALTPPRVEADVIVSHLALRWSALPMLIALRSDNAGRRLIHVEHGYCEGFQACNVVREGRFHALLRTAFSLFDAVVAVSRAQAEWMRREGIAQNADLRVAHPLTRLAGLADLTPAAEGRPRVFGALGRFDRQKGFDRLIEAFRLAAAPEAELRLFGDGPERERLQALASGDPRIAFPGFVSEAAEALAQVDAVAMPSRWEAFGLTGLEARVAGRPLLAASVDGLRDQIAAGAIPVGEGVEGWISVFREPPRTTTAQLVRARAEALLEAAEAEAAWRAILTPPAGGAANAA